MALTIDLGTFYEGEIPPPLVHTFQKYDGSAWDLTDWTVVEFSSVGDVITGTPVISEPTAGEVTYTWLAEDMGAAGTHLGYIWIQNSDGSVKLSSGPIRWRIELGLLTP